MTIDKARVAQMLEMRAKGQTYKQIGAHFGISYQRAHKIVITAQGKKKPDTSGSNTLCWRCANATGGCNWSRYKDPQPVVGWTARKVAWRGTKYGNTSYIVRHCPEYVHDGRHG